MPQVEAKIKHETERAFLVILDADGSELWLPKSQARVIGEGLFEVPQWLLDKRTTGGAPTSTAAPNEQQQSWYLLHSRVAKITGAISLYNNRSTPAQFREWAAELRAIATEMEKSAS